MSPRGVLVLDGAGNTEDLDVTVTRRDLHGNEWEVTTLAHQSRTMAEIITAEWGRNEHKVVHKASYTYVCCKCDKQPRCSLGMVVKYTLLEEDVVRMGMFSAGISEKRSVKWPQCLRIQLLRWKSLQRVCHHENTIEEVKALVAHIQEREVTQDLRISDPGRGPGPRHYMHLHGVLCGYFPAAQRGQHSKAFGWGAMSRARSPTPK